MPFSTTGDIRSSPSCFIRLGVMASLLSPGTWVNFGGTALAGTAGGGCAPAADRLQADVALGHAE